MANKVLNFDKFMSEKKKETITVTVFGKEYTVPSEIPAIVPVMMARAEDSGDNSAATKMVMKAADVFFGEKAVNSMCSNGLSSQDLAALIQQIFQKISGVEEEDSEEQELTDEGGMVEAPGSKKASKK